MKVELAREVLPYMKAQVGDPARLWARMMTEAAKSIEEAARITKRTEELKAEEAPAPSPRRKTMTRRSARKT